MDGKSSELNTGQQETAGVSISKYILSLSYNLISHYDKKTNQQLTIVGFDFAIISMLITAMFTTNTIGAITKVFIFLSSIVSYSLLIAALTFVRKALIPHVEHHNKMKSKPGMLYFMDIKAGFEQEDKYVKMMLGDREELRTSQFYRNDDPDAFEKCFIEDCARDIYAHAIILENKTRYVYLAFNWVFAATVSCILTVAISSVLWLLKL